MKGEVFNRKEVKYIVTEEEYNAIRGIIKEHMVLDKYNIDEKPYSIYSLYFDTKQNDFISGSLLKPIYKEKIRIRSYEKFKDNSLCFLEIKKKYNGYGNKRRTRITYKDAIKFVETGVRPKYKEYMNAQVLKELEFIINKDKLYPKVFISYDRIAYYSLDDPNLRVTFDKNIIAKRGNINTTILDSDKYVLEIKTNKSLPLWLARALSSNKIYERSFSKYGEEYKKHCDDNAYKLKKNNLFKEGEVNYGTDFKLEYC